MKHNNNEVLERILDNDSAHSLKNEKQFKFICDVLKKDPMKRTTEEINKISSNFRK